MSDRTILSKVTACAIPSYKWFCSIFSALTGAFIGRDPVTGKPEPCQPLGTEKIPWGTANIKELVVDGKVINFTDIAPPIRVCTGRLNSNNLSSNQEPCTPDILRANGTGIDIYASNGDPIELKVNGAIIQITSTINIDPITLVSSGGNTALVNDITLTGQESSSYDGEDGDTITIDNPGVEIINSIGQVCGFSINNGSNTEYFIAYVENANTLSNVYRGYFFDSNGNPIPRITISDNDVITKQQLNWIFIDSDSVTAESTQYEPVCACEEPDNPQIGQYWYDMKEQNWKRWSGTGAWAIVNRALIGIAIADNSQVIGTRTYDFWKPHSSHNDILLSYVDDSTVEFSNTCNTITVDGVNLDFCSTKQKFSLTDNLEAGYVEQANTTYYVYIDHNGCPYISPVKYYSDCSKKGKYHPYNTCWRYLGKFANNNNADIDPNSLQSDSGGDKPSVQVFTSSGNYIKSSTCNYVKVTVIGEGGGYNNNSLDYSPTGQTSSFGTFASATGGQSAHIGAGLNQSNSANGGVGIGGDINITGANAFIYNQGGSFEEMFYRGITGYGYGNGSANIITGFSNDIIYAGAAGGVAIRYISCAELPSLVNITVGNGVSNGGQGAVIVEEF